MLIVKACMYCTSHTYVYEVNLNNSKVDLVVKAARVMKNTFTWGISGMYTLSIPEVSMSVPNFYRK